MEISVVKQMRVMEAEDEEEEDIRAVFGEKSWQSCQGWHPEWRGLW